VCRCGERMRNRRDDDGAQERGEACGGEHRDIAIAAHDHHHRRYQDRHDEREQVTEQVTRGERAADHHDDTDERHEAGGERRPMLPVRRPRIRQRSRDERRRRVDHQHVGDARLAQRVDEADCRKRR
jgi:hypothetical protein